jgi:hypothetical protein
MQDACLLLAKRLACPLKTPRGTELYQLWRADFKALLRLALVCKETAAAVKLLLWKDTALGARARARQMHVTMAHAFLQLPRVAPLIASAEWTRPHNFSSVQRGSTHIRVRVSVAFNGRIRIREYIFPGRRLRRAEGCSGSAGHVGMTLSGTEQGRVHIVFVFKEQPSPMWKGAFTDRDGALGSLRYFTLLGREHWKKLQPMEHRRLEQYCGSDFTNLSLHQIVNYHNDGGPHARQSYTFI